MDPKYVPDNFLNADQKVAKREALNRQVEEYEGYGKRKLSTRDPAQQKIQEALAAEKAQLKEDVSRLEELVKLQRMVTGGTKFTKTSVEAAARILKQYANAKRMSDTGELAQLLHTFYETVASDPNPSWERTPTLGGERTCPGQYEKGGSC